MTNKVDAAAESRSSGASRVVVITGAGSGLGRVTARALLNRGHHVVLAGRRSELLEETAQGDPRSHVVVVDVKDPMSVRRLFEEASHCFGRVDVLFNNAGVFGPVGPITELSDDAWTETWQTNVSGSLFCAREAAKVMLTQRPRGGRIINNGSISAHRPRVNTTAYAVSKHAITGLSASLQLDLRDLDIAVTQIDIGNASTSITAQLGLDQTGAATTATAEPTFDPVHVAQLLVLITEMPLDVTVPTLTVMARSMPYAGRG